MSLEPIINGRNAATEPRLKHVQCLDPMGLHRMAYWEWGDPANDKVVVGSDDGRVYVVSLANGKQIWNYEIGQPVESSPAVADGRFVVGANDGGVYCFGAKK